MNNRPYDINSAPHSFVVTQNDCWLTTAPTHTCTHTCPPSLALAQGCQCCSPPGGLTYCDCWSTTAPTHTATVASATFPFPLTLPLTCDLTHLLGAPPTLLPTFSLTLSPSLLLKSHSPSCSYIQPHPCSHSRSHCPSLTCAGPVCPCCGAEGRRAVSLESGALRWRGPGRAGGTPRSAGGPSPPGGSPPPARHHA